MSAQDVRPQNPEVAGNTSQRGRTIRGGALVALLMGLMLTLLLEALDQTIVGTAAPKIIASLQGFDSYTWVATAYLLASTAVIPIVGKLSDLWGRKWFFIGGVIAFLLGSLLSGLAQNMGQLIAFRTIQGLGAGVGVALVFTAVGDIFPPAERSRWQGIFAAVYGFASVVGPTLGGWLTDNGPLLGNIIVDTTRWRWIFYINLPIGLLALLILFIFYPAKLAIPQKHLSLRQIDFMGALLATIATICLLLGLSWGSNQIYAWLSPQVIIILAAAAVVYSAFFLVESRVNDPIVPLHLFRNQLFAADCLLALTIGMILLALVFYLPLYLQGILGESATSSGAVITPLTLSIVVGSAVAGILIARLGRYRFIAIIGGILLCIGSFWLTRFDASTSILTTSIAMIITGIGLGLFFPLLNLIIQNGLPRKFMGASTGAVTYLRSLGQTLGLAIVGTVVNHSISAGLLFPASASTLSPRSRMFATNPQVLIDPTFRQTIVKTATYFAQQIAVAKATANIPPGPKHAQQVALATQQAMQQTAQTELATLNQVFAALKTALVGALSNGFLCILIFAFITLIVALFLKDVPLSKEFTDEEELVYASSAPSALNNQVNE